MVNTKGIELFLASLNRTVKSSSINTHRMPRSTLAGLREGALSIYLSISHYSYILFASLCFYGKSNLVISFLSF